MLSISPSRVVPTNRTRKPLQLEALEDRTCPAAPQLSYSVTEVMGMVQIQGTVIDENPQSAFVSFSGVVNGYAPVSSNGTFSLTLSAYGPGVIRGVAFDNQGLTSGQVDAVFSSQAPGVTFSATWGANKQVTITGRVTDESPGQTSVTFSGSISYMITPDANGNFCFTTTAQSVGQITAYVGDRFWQSGTASIMLTNTAPTITNFQVSIAPGGFYTFTGTVTDESAAGLTVTFGGLPSLFGKITPVAANGTFSLTIELPAGEDGEAQARITDWWGVQSTLATLLVV